MALVLLESLLRFVVCTLLPGLPRTGVLRLGAHQHISLLGCDARLRVAGRLKAMTAIGSLRKTAAFDFQWQQVDHFAHFGSRFKVVMAATWSSNGSQRSRAADRKQRSVKQIPRACCQAGAKMRDPAPLGDCKRHKSAEATQLTTPAGKTR